MSLLSCSQMFEQVCQYVSRLHAEIDLCNSTFGASTRAGCELGAMLFGRENYKHLKIFTIFLLLTLGLMAYKVLQRHLKEKVDNLPPNGLLGSKVKYNFLLLA